MKHLLATCILLLSALKAHAVGLQVLDIPGPGSKPISLAIWYPSQAGPQAVNLGTFSQDVAANGAIEGSGLPLVLISHGTGGYKFSHHDTALALANAGFIAVALTHPGDNYADQSEALNILERPKHLVMALDYMLKQWPQRDRIAASRVGVFGFSSGGFTALVSVGGEPDLGKVFPHCLAHPDQYVCAVVGKQSAQAIRVPMAATPALHERRIRAAVIVAPALGFTFDAAALRQVSVPIQLWRAGDDAILPNPWYAEAVRAALPSAPDYHVVPQAGHFDFLAPCTDKLAAVAPQICISAPGFDRAEFHQRFNTDVIAYFRKSLTPLPTAADAAPAIRSTLPQGR
ncbi:MAG: alpha/beta hydrolase family protein [Massilia sp.]